MTVIAAHPSDLEPSLVAARTYASRRPPVRLDVAAVISFQVILLYGLPATLIVPELTFAGRPALLLGMALFAWWIISKLNPWLTMMGPQPLRWAVLAYLLSFLLSYLAGMLRGLPTMESNAQNFTMLVTLEFVGLVLMTADGVPNWARLRGILKVFVWSGAFMAFVGLVQSVLNYDLRQYLLIPGLEIKSGLADFALRGDGGLFRVAGTATHYIEFSTVLAVAIPFGIHFTFFAPTRNARIGFAVATLLMAAGLPLAISRTGVLALAVAVLTMFVLAWNWRMRYNVMIVGVLVVAGLAMVKPGIVGTFRAMFQQADSDPSITGRTDDYSYIAYWFSQRPMLGRGPGTLVPELYLILDNQWLMTLVTTGVLGVLALLLLHIMCISLAWIALRRSARREDRHLCAALISTQLIAMLVGLTFDSFSFTTFSFTLALLSGACGVVWRVTHPARTVRTSIVRKMTS